MIKTLPALGRLKFPPTIYWKIEVQRERGKWGNWVELLVRSSWCS